MKKTSSIRTAKSRTGSPLGGVAFGLALGLGIAAVAGCSTTGKMEVTKTAINAMPKHQRAQEFEATARVMESEPGLIDELYAVMRTHPVVMQRMMTIATKDMTDPALAEMASNAIANDPAALEQVLETSLDVIAKHPEARAAMNRAMNKRAEVATDILTDNPDTVARVLAAGLVVIEKKPAARKGALLAVRKDRGRLVAFAKSDPRLLEDMGVEILREVVKDKPALAKMLQAAKVIEPEPVTAGPAAPLGKPLTR